MKTNPISSFFLLTVLVLSFSCNKEDDPKPVVTDDNSTEAIKINFSKKFITKCAANFIIYVSANSSYIIPSGVTPIGGCSSSVTLNLSTEVLYRFVLGKTSTSAQVYAGSAKFHEVNGEITMVLSDVISPDGYNLFLVNNCNGSGPKDLVIQ